MTRKRYLVILPSLIVGFLAVGFLLGILVPTLPSSFYVVLVLVGGAVILLVDRLARRQVSEALTDERIDRIMDRSTMISFRVATVVAMVCCLALSAIFPSAESVRFIAVGVGCTLGLQSLILIGAYIVIRRRS